MDIAADDLDAYDLAIERALAAVRLHGDQTLSRKKRVERTLDRMTAQGLDAVSIGRQGVYPVYEAMLARSWAFRHDNPQKMVEYAWYATRAAASLERDGFTPEQAADLQARALGELANAFRVADRLAEAEVALKQAVNLCRTGTGDPFVAVRLRDLRASLLGSQHRYSEAVELLKEAFEEHLRLGDRHGAGRTLVTQGLYTGFLGAPGEALGAIDRGLEMIDAEREPGLKIQAIHNQLHFMVSFGLIDQALALLSRSRESLLAAGGRLDRAKLLGLEGRIHARLGNFDLAERALREAKRTFEDLDVRGHWANACLDLSAVVLAMGRNSEARNLAEEAMRVFRHLKIEAGVTEALSILNDVLRSELLTASFLQKLADFVRHAEHAPEARFNPDFG